jgi:dTDP-4-dehydrorhamnose reductase
MASAVKILVTGARGMLGGAVVRAASAGGHEVVDLGREELDVSQAGAVNQRFQAERPDAVVHCAAYSDVDGAEGDLRGAMAGNAEASAKVAEAAAAVGARTVYPSSDYVFDGLKGEPYVESDVPRPQSVYGQSKLAGEHEVSRVDPRHLVVRSSWLFGSGGRNFVDTMLRLAEEHGEVAVVTDQVGSPTYTGHLASGLLRLLESGSSGLHHLAAAGECSWHELALETFRRAGVSCVVRELTTAELGRPAPRPPRSTLVSEREDAVLLPTWQEGLAEYLSERTVEV